MKKSVLFIAVMAAMLCVAAMAQDAPRSGPVFVSQPVVPTV
jgi:hypothetical protein